MIPSCNDQREELILAASENRELNASQRDHVARCVACRALMARVAASVEALGDLTRLEAPADLEGRVVASLNAGFREDRSVRHLSTLEKLAAPNELEHSLQVADELEADLFARVEQELLRPEDSVGHRLPRVVDRLEVPAELEQRVAAELRGARTGRAVSRIAAHARSRSRDLVQLAGAANRRCPLSRPLRRHGRARHRGPVPRCRARELRRARCTGREASSSAARAA